MNDLTQTDKSGHSPYKKSKTLNLYWMALNIVAIAIRSFVRYRLFRQARPERDSALYRKTLQQLQQQDQACIAELELQRQQLASKSHFVRKRLLPGLAMVAAALTLLLVGFTIFIFLLTFKLEVHIFVPLLGAYFWAIFIAVIAIVFTYAKAYDQYNVRYRNLFIPALAKSFGQVQYQQYGFIDLNTLKDSLILPGHDLIYQEDYFAGVHRHCTFELVEAELYKRDHGKQRDNLSFSGLIIAIDLPYSFHSTTLVRKNSALLNVQRKTPQGMQRVHLEDRHFQQAFRVHSDDQIAARSWLTPAVMYRLEQLAKVLDCSDFQASLYRDKLVVLLNLPQDFLPPPPIDTPLSDATAGYEFVAELSAVYQLIEALLAQFSSAPQSTD